MERSALHLGANIGFLFQKEHTFQAGVAELYATDPVLAEYQKGCAPGRRIFG